MKRDKKKLEELKRIKPNQIEPNPVFNIEGEVED